MRMLAVFLLAFASHAAAAAEAKRLEIEGVGLGDSIAQVKAAWPSAKCPERAEREGGPFNCMALNTTVAGQAATLVAALDDDRKVARVTLRDLDPAAFDVVAEALVGKLGAPDSDDRRGRFDPRLGTQVPHRSLKWARDGIALAGSQYATSTASAFTLAHALTEADIEARAAERLRQRD
jgi:hypothetical protein